MRARKGGAAASVVHADETWSVIAPSTPTGVYPTLVKPLLDRVMGLVLLILFSPVIAVSALAILVTMGGPVFYSQQRIGLDGRAFRFYKLRTMIPDRRISEMKYIGVERRITHKSHGDPRVTSVGRILRAARLDELPQFLNVVKGDMSMVGPRPELPEIVSRYEPWQHHRHIVKPGVTGPWQISDRNGDLMFEHTEIDLAYLEHVGFVSDLKILAQTPMAMLGGKKGH